ncbi:DUF2199 domain-containing protein [Micromonospora zamorensis]|uniref:DUF2199 domain-containing protein n=1 Tax=Micromonospora zamorensis TaxID=709883 RepID=UPI0033EC4B5F
MCGVPHSGRAPSYRVEYPSMWRAEFVTDERSFLDEEQCVVQMRWFLVRARLVIPLEKRNGDIEWGVWVSLAEPDFERMDEYWLTPGRERQPPFPGVLDSALPGYATPTAGLPVLVHTSPVGIRPTVKVTDTTHELAREQQRGITVSRHEELNCLVRAL